MTRPDADLRELRGSIRRQWRGGAEFAAVVALGLAVALIAVLTLTPSDDHVLMQKIRTVKYYWIPVAAPSIPNPWSSQQAFKVRSGQLLADAANATDGAQLAANATGAGNQTNATNATNATEVDPTEFPPYGEPVGLPPPECDIEEMSNCLGALEAQMASAPMLAYSDAETAHHFCTSMNAPFQCACKACKLDLLGPWDYMYWHSNVTALAKQLLTKMRAEAQCKKLRQVGVANFPPGHGCNMLYDIVCTDPQLGHLEPRQQLHEFVPFDSHFCPRVLANAEMKSRAGVVGSLLHDDAFWTNPHRTCTQSHQWHDELQCKHQFQLAAREDPAGGRRCPRMRDYLVCVCDACGRDVNDAVNGMARWWSCSAGNATWNESDTSACSQWKAAECEIPLTGDYCSKVEGTKAWKKLHPEKPPPVGTWDDDGMSWDALCRQAVEPLGENEDLLESLLGPGWVKWCDNYVKAKGQKWGPQPGAVPNGAGLLGHLRLPVSGMPAPRSYDHDDVEGGTPVNCPGPHCGV